MKQAQKAAAPARVVLEGVPRAGFYDPSLPGCPEDITFAGALTSCLKYLGDYPGCDHARAGDVTWGVGCTYAYTLGASGGAFYLGWPASGWDMGAQNLAHIAPETGEQFGRALAAAGYGHEMLLKTEHARSLLFTGPTSDDEDDYRRRIVESLRDRGRPVLAFGVIGPPECCVITGYDEGGDVLLGWNFFQGMPEMAAGVEIEPNGYFRKHDWFKDTQGLIFIGEKQPRPPLAEVFRQALEWGLEVARGPRVREYHTGFAAYTAWCEALLRDGDFPDDLPLLRDRHMVHYDAVGALAEARWYGSLFLKQVAAALPKMAGELEAAAECYVAEHDLMWAVWEFAGGNGVSDGHARRLADPGVRRRIVPLLRLARKEGAEAAAHIERALQLG